MFSPKPRQMEAIAGWLFILPSALGFTLLTLVPILFSLVISFTDWNYLSGLNGIRFTGLENFIVMWEDRWFTDSLKNNLIFVGGIVPATIVLSLLAALGLNGKAFLKTPIRLMIFMPYISSIVAASIAWGALYHPSYGPINGFLKSIGIADPPTWLASSKWALLAVMIMIVWSCIGYNMVIYLAGLQNIPKDLYEAGKIDGTGAVSEFRYITVPLLSPTTFFILITSIIHSFQVFVAIFVMTKGGPGTATSVLTYYIYQAGFGFYRMGYASAMAWILFVMIFLVTVIQWQGQKKWVNY